MPTPQICDASLQSGALKPNRAIESNRNLSWRSLLLDIHEGAGRCDPFDTHCTADLAVIVSISGRHETEVVKRGRWRIAVYEPGSAGLIAGQNIARLRWNALDRAPFQTAHIRGVRSHHVSSGEFRHTFTPTVDVPVAALAFRDPAIASSVAALMNARRVEGPGPILQRQLQGRVFLTQKLAPLLNDGGRIDNTSSGLVRFCFPRLMVYASIEGAIEPFTRNLSHELGQRGIAVNTIAQEPW